jgi:hypothetical protein
MFDLVLPHFNRAMPILPHAQNAPMVDAMTSRMVSVFAAALTAGLVVYDPSTEAQRVPDPIDFVRLNHQAATALQLLQAAQARRLTETETAVTF